MNASRLTSTCRTRRSRKSGMRQNTTSLGSRSTTRFPEFACIDRRGKDKDAKTRALSCSNVIRRFGDASRLEVPDSVFLDLGVNALSRPTRGDSRMIPAVPRSCISTASARTACNCGHAGIQPIDLISLFLDANASLNYIQNLHVLRAIRSWPTGQSGCLNLVCAKS